MLFAYVPTSTGATWHTASGHSNGQLGVASINATNTYLSGFALTYTNGDHHVDHVAVVASPRAVTTYLEDNGHDDPYDRAVEYVTIP